MRVDPKLVKRTSGSLHMSHWHALKRKGWRQFPNECELAACLRSKKRGQSQCLNNQSRGRMVEGAKCQHGTIQEENCEQVFKQAPSLHLSRVRFLALPSKKDSEKMQSTLKSSWELVEASTCQSGTVSRVKGGAKSPRCAQATTWTLYGHTL